jgi:hypothetical protein
MNSLIKEVDGVEITTIQDNYIDLLAHGNTAVIQRAIPLTPDLEINNSVLAEHGFCALVTLTARLFFSARFRDRPISSGSVPVSATITKDATNLI